MPVPFKPGELAPVTARRTSWYDPAAFHDLISGRRRGPTAMLTRAALRAAEVPYSIAMRWRNRRYDRGRTKTYSVDVPVISVGNLTLGGTGKTPVVAWLARWLRDRDVRVTIVSRGYGAGDASRNDEALELEQRLPDVPHMQNPDRVEAARVAIEEFDCQMILLDDGFQHRRLERDLDIVLLDALAPFGYEHIFPRGALREPAAGLKRADAVLLSRADAIDATARAALRDRARRLAPDAVWAEVAHAPQALFSSSGIERPLGEVEGKRVAAFCGIGNPAGFRHTLAGLGCQVAAFREFPDHHAYTRADVESLSRWADETNAEAVLTTHKDLVKIGLDDFRRRPLWAVSIGISFLSGLSELEEELTALLPRE